MNTTQSDRLPPVAGIDLSLTSTGLVIVNSAADIQLHRIKSKGTRADTLEQRTVRLDSIRDRLCYQIVPGTRVVIEAPAYGTPGGSTHDRSGLWHLVVNALWREGCPITEVVNTTRAMYALPTQPKRDKDAVLAAVIRRYPDVPVDQNDVGDSLVLAAMGARRQGSPIEPPEATLFDVYGLHLKVAQAMAAPVWAW